MRMDRQADVRRVAAHLDRERDLGDQVAGAGTDDAAAEDAVGAGSNSSLVKPSSRFSASDRPLPPTETSVRVLRPVPSRRSRQADPGDFGIGIGDRGNHARVEAPSRPRHSAATLPSCVALWASIGCPTTSPMAKMCGTLVRFCRRRNETALVDLTPAVSAPIAGRSGAADGDQHAVISVRCVASSPSNVTSPAADASTSTFVPIGSSS